MLIDDVYDIRDNLAEMADDIERAGDAVVVGIILVNVGRFKMLRGEPKEKNTIEDVN